MCRDYRTPHYSLCTRSRIRRNTTIPKSTVKQRCNCVMLTEWLVFRLAPGTHVVRIITVNICLHEVCQLPLLNARSGKGLSTAGDEVQDPSLDYFPSSSSYISVRTTELMNDTIISILVVNSCLLLPCTEWPFEMDVSKIQIQSFNNFVDEGVKVLIQV